MPISTRTILSLRKYGEYFMIRISEKERHTFKYIFDVSERSGE